jgi:hypothetical protein
VKEKSGVQRGSAWQFGNSGRGDEELRKVEIKTSEKKLATDSL